MKLLNEKEIEEAAKSDMWFESIGTPSSDYQLGFRIGAGVAEQKLTPLFAEFAQWCLTETRRDNVGCMATYVYEGNAITTQKLLEKFIEQRNKKEQ